MFDHRIKTVAYGGDDGNDETSPSREDGKETNDELSSSQDCSNDKSPVHPPSNLLVGVKSLLEVVAKHVLHRCVLETPDVDGIEPEIRLRRRAVCVLLDAGIIILARTVRPQANLVEIFEVLGGGCACQGIEQVIFVTELVEFIREFVRDALRVLPEGSHVCL